MVKRQKSGKGEVSPRRSYHVPVLHNEANSNTVGDSAFLVQHCIVFRNQHEGRIGGAIHHGTGIKKLANRASSYVAVTTPQICEARVLLRACPHLTYATDDGTVRYSSSPLSEPLSKR